MKFVKINSKSGFALVATMSILSLVVMIALAMVSLAGISVKTAGGLKSIELARANARLALSEAIGRLQFYTGSDSRITAPADSVVGAAADAPRHLTGAWRSWEGHNQNLTNGLPIAPDYTSKLVAGDPKDGNEKGRFLGWLVSHDVAASPTTPPSLTASADTIPLLSNGTLGSDVSMDDLEVHVTPNIIKDSLGEEIGGYCWWVQGNNTKALIQPKQSDPTNEADWSKRLSSSPVMDSEQLGIVDNGDLDKINSHDSLEFVSGYESKIYHDITNYSVGLHTNAATGGWKRDFSLFAEKWGERSPWGTPCPEDGFSTFNIEPFVENSSALKMSSSASEASIYNWATSDNVSMSWNAIADFASLYKKVETDSVTGTPYFDFSSSGSDSSDYFSIREPLLARIQFVFAYSSQIEADGSYTPLLSLKPTATYFNPYKVV